MLIFFPGKFLRTDPTDKLIGEAVLNKEALHLAKSGRPEQKKALHPLAIALAPTVQPISGGFNKFGAAVTQAISVTARQSPHLTSQRLQGLDPTSREVFCRTHKIFMELAHNASTDPHNFSVHATARNADTAASQGFTTHGPVLMLIWDAWVNLMAGLTTMTYHKSDIVCIVD